jgi:hypothetical protein
LKVNFDWLIGSDYLFSALLCSRSPMHTNEWFAISASKQNGINFNSLLRTSSCLNNKVEPRRWRLHSSFSTLKYLIHFWVMFDLIGYL